jgi:hypothetical protein
VGDEFQDGEYVDGLEADPSFRAGAGTRDLAAAFEASRGRLRAIAYRMLGSLSDTDDAVPFDDIAAIVGRSPNAAAQLASRARRRVRGSAVATDTSLARQREVVGAWIAAARGGDFAAGVRRRRSQPTASPYTAEPAPTAPSSRSLSPLQSQTCTAGRSESKPAAKGSHGWHTNRSTAAPLPTWTRATVSTTATSTPYFR